MNFIDITEELVSNEKELQKIDNIIKSLKECQLMCNNYHNGLFGLVLINQIEGNTTIANNNSKQIKDSTKQHYTDLKNKLNTIDFKNYWIVLNNLSKISNQVSIIEDSTSIFDDAYETIHAFTSETDIKNIPKMYGVTVSAITSIISEYKYLYKIINIIKDINLKLNLGIEESNFTIEFQTGNNTLENALLSLKAIESMYNTVCSIIDVQITEEPLRYNRIETGCLLVCLVGSIPVINILGRIIAFTYTVYKEQIGWKAKQERALGNIKIRGDYRKLIKEELGIDDVDIMKMGADKLNIKLGELEEANKELYKNNTYIKLNGDNIGIKELDIKELDIKQIPEGLFIEGSTKKPTEQLEDNQLV
ncbi:hypothetical protein K2F40_16825 [Clostridium sp. CM028]|uniref:hypothetical protein n=1 Tax=Clostridium sp. CM028 TaxID=2851575 RepID=UPI001C6EF2E9|nr:hypothetical protein [Clostridium sp. CM028]MBW9150593.1 hypothetical protein [Clostridium sp. CM028]WLC63529.1 hypothetical protein KTC94_17450 [Clostridium sp. CM028]